MSRRPADIWYGAVCRSRARQGIESPPFRWRYLRRPWGWRYYVWGGIRHAARAALAKARGEEVKP